MACWRLPPKSSMPKAFEPARAMFLKFFKVRFRCRLRCRGNLEQLKVRGSTALGH